MIYLDNAATTQPEVKAIKYASHYLYGKWQNPSSLYQPSRNIKQDINNVKNNIAKFLGANQDEIYFTSGGSESNSWAIKGFVDYCLCNEYTPIVITSKIEHKSILSCIEYLHQIKIKTYFVDVNKDGHINKDQLEDILYSVLFTNDEEIRILVSIQHGNNEIGTIQDIKEISKIVHKYDAILHVDAVQTFGHMIINVDDFGIDMLSASGHKIGCTKGIGFLYKRNGVEINPLIYGSQENGLRGGTENVFGIMCFDKALEICKNNLLIREMNICNLREYLISKLIECFGCKVNGCRIFRVANNINVTFVNQKITGEALIYLLEMSNIYISSGSACNSTSSELSSVLKAIGLSDEDALKTIRITLSKYISQKDIDLFVEELRKQVELLEI